MISNTMEQMLNEQLNKELFSEHLYLSMSAYFKDLNLDGFANFFMIQSQEEHLHAMKQFEYIDQVDGRIKMMAIEAPQNEFEGIQQVFQMTLDHEREVTASINKIVGKAIEEQDFATHQFFQWFIAEQVEEESSIKTILKKIEMVGDNSSAMYLLNDELNKRTLDTAALI